MIYARGWGALAGWQANKWGCGNQPSSHDGGRIKFTHGEKGDAPGARLLHESSEEVIAWAQPKWHSSRPRQWGYTCMLGEEARRVCRESVVISLIENSGYNLISK